MQSQKNKAITLVTLVVTIVVLLILVAISINLLVGENGIINKSIDAKKNYTDVTQEEKKKLEDTDIWIDEQIGNSSKEEKKPIDKVNYKGYYADVDEDGTVDGIIYADLAIGGSGQWNNVDGVYSIPIKTNLKDYYISQKNYTGKFGTKDVISPIKKSKGTEERFYIMSLEDFDLNRHSWYKSANGTLHASWTKLEFGEGKNNTSVMINIWNKDSSVEKNNSDMWGVIQEKTNTGWFVPSRAEWAAFVQELEITSDYPKQGLSNFYWSSSLNNTGRAWTARFNLDSMSNYPVNYDYSIRLSMTF